jgi:hypothetical protein
MKVMTASEIHSHLDRLRAERAEARDTGLAEVQLYMADLEREIDQCRHAYVRAAVAELAARRAEDTGRLVG